MSASLRCLFVVLLLGGLWGTFAVPRVRAADPLEVGDTAVVATTEGDVLALRAGPGVEYAALTAFTAGAELPVLAGPVPGADGRLWYQVTGDGLAGWSAAEWLASPTAGGDTRYIGGTDGGANLRADPTLAGDVLLVVPEGGAVIPLGESGHADGLAWALVRYGTTTGWVAGAFLGGVSAGGGGEPVGTGAPTSAPGTPGIAVGGNARVVGTDGYDLRLRDGIGLAAPIFATIPADTVVVVVNGPLADETGAPWYGVGYDGLHGWVLGEHLLSVAAPPSSRRQSDVGAMGAYGVGGAVAAGPVVSDPVRGAAIVVKAAQYVGTRYVWGGDDPSGWDCSGMIQWLYGEVSGLTLPRVSQDQWRYGTPLRPEQVEAGDLVFFLDTDGPGITHNGIALGDGRFIHARSASLGTVISRLDEPFWVAHYAGARRP